MITRPFARDLDEERDVPQVVHGAATLAELVAMSLPLRPIATPTSAVDRAVVDAVAHHERAVSARDEVLGFLVLLPRGRHSASIAPTPTASALGDREPVAGEDAHSRIAEPCSLLTTRERCAQAFVLEADLPR
ncbi:MAG: hypothetical protein U0575_16965 [Phycisphaerales bacterium]